VEKERDARTWWRIGAGIFAVISFGALLYAFSMRDQERDERAARDDLTIEHRPSGGPSRSSESGPVEEERAPVEEERGERDAGALFELGGTEPAPVEEPQGIEAPSLPNAPAPPNLAPPLERPPVAQRTGETTPEMLLGRTRGLRQVYDERLQRLRADRTAAVEARDQGRVEHIDYLISRLESQLPTLRARERQYEGLVRRSNGER
jgi:hypothetical protein